MSRRLKGVILLVGGALTLGSTGRCTPAFGQSDRGATMVNFDHLDRLMEFVEHEGEELAIVHIYSEAPDYGWVGDDDEGIACVDDAARAAVLFLRHYELTGEPESRARAAALLRFVMYMQTDDGLFYNFVWDSGLQKNTTHPNSVAKDFAWWAARGLWALGRCAEVFRNDPAAGGLAERCAERARRSLPQLDVLLTSYPETREINGRLYPRWLIRESAADATSELLLGLAAMQRAEPDAVIEFMIGRFAEGVQMMQFGGPRRFPFGAHASWMETWHAWGNAQTQALAEIGRLRTAFREAESFFPRLLLEDWLHSLDFADLDARRRFEQIAYGVRCVSTGLLRLYEATGYERFAVMAGIAASWLTGANAAGVPMYDPETGRAYDGVQGPSKVNYNSGAESTIEALLTLIEIERAPAAKRWLRARGGFVRRHTVDGSEVLYRIYESAPVQTAYVELDETRRAGIILHLTRGETNVLAGRALAEFLKD